MLTGFLERIARLIHNFCKEIDHMASKFTKGIFKTPKWQLSENQVTSESTFSQRRKIIKSLGIGSLAASLSSNAHAGLFDALFNHFSDSEKNNLKLRNCNTKN